MTERDIRGHGLLFKAFADGMVSEMPAKNRAAAEALVTSGLELAIQALVDLNRIADALEHIATKEQ